MYKIEIMTKSTNSEEHLEFNIKNIHSYKQRLLDFKAPWRSTLPILSEAEWAELKEKGIFKKTVVRTETTIVWEI